MPAPFYLYKNMLGLFFPDDKKKNIHNEKSYFET